MTLSYEKKVDVLTIDYFFKHANCKKDDYEIDFQIVNNFFKHENWKKIATKMFCTLEKS